MGCGDEKLSKYLTQTFTAHCNAMICQQVTLSGDAEWPKVADAVIEARNTVSNHSPALARYWTCVAASLRDMGRVSEKCPENLGGLFKGCLPRMRGGKFTTFWWEILVV